MEGQPFLVEARERPVEEKSPLPLPVEGAGTGPLLVEVRSGLDNDLKFVLISFYFPYSSAASVHVAATLPDATVGAEEPTDIGQGCKYHLFLIAE